MSAASDAATMAPARMSYTHMPPGAPAERAQQFMVRMRDGIRLATDVYLPDVDGPVPAVLIRLPYDKNGRFVRIDVLADALLERGYALVAQDCRGKFRSEGETFPWISEAHDGYDTIDWIASRPWSNGRVGMTGHSYTGYTQWAALSTNHPALRAIAPRGTNTALGSPLMTPNEPEWSFPFQYVMDFYAVRDGMLPETAHDWGRRPLAEAFEAVVDQLGVRPPAMDMYLSSESPSQQQRFPDGHPLAAKPVPVLLSLGLYDQYCAAEALRHDYPTMVADPAWRPLVHLRLGPHDHMDFRLDDRPGPTQAGELSVAQIRSWFDGELQFFDRYLKADGAVEPPAPVEYQLAHSAEVRRTVSWPPPEATHQVLHLVDGPTRRLVERPATATGPISWVHDPDMLVPTAATSWSSFVAEWPDFREYVNRPDALVFRADPQDRHLELAGPVTFHGQVSTTGPAMDLFAHLLDLEPDGAVRSISRGQQRLVAAEPTDLTMSVGQAGYVVRPGHSLLLMLCSSDYPDFIPLTGTDERWWSATSMRSTTQTLDIGGDAGARLELTVL